MFAGLEGDEDEDLEIEKAMEEYRKKGGVIIGRVLKFLRHIFGFFFKFQVKNLKFILSCAHFWQIRYVNIIFWKSLRLPS